MTEKSADPGRHVLVVGFGSPIRGDDAVGAMIADELIDELSCDHITVHARHILTAELVSDLEAASLAVFIDASADGAPGEVQCRRIEPEVRPQVVMTHDMDPRELLAWTHRLYQHVPETWLVSVRAIETEFAQYQLSPTVQAAFLPIKEKVRRLIAEHLGVLPAKLLGKEPPGSRKQDHRA